MRYDDKDLIDRLAGAYVLGTLTGPARRRFDRLAVHSRDVREAIWRWERELNRLADQVDPETPPPRVWRALAQRIAPVGKAAAGARFWRGWALTATFMAVALLVPLATQQSVVTTDQVALIQDAADGEPLWVISVDLDNGALRTRAVNAPARELDRVFELWMLPGQGAPQSLGLLPVSGQRQQHQLSPALVAILQRSAGLAVSIEPAGGSPTGLPTGPVVYQASLVEL